MTRLLAASILLILTFSSSVYAHEDDVNPFVTITCDNAKQTLFVSEEIAKSEEEIPKNPNTWGLDAMLKFEPDPTGDDGTIEVKTTIKQTCKIGGAKYTLVVYPYNFQHRAQGECGASAPAVQLTVNRNGNPLIRQLLFRLECAEDGDYDTVINDLILSEPSQNAVFRITNKEMKTQKTIPYKELPALQRERLFQ